MAALSAGPCLLCLAASRNMHTPLQQNPGPATICPGGHHKWHRGSQGEQTFPLSRLHPQRYRSHLESFLFFSFILPGCVSFLQHWLLRDLQDFSWYSVKIVSRVDVFLMCLWGTVSSKSLYSTISFTERETPVIWPPDAKNWLIWKDPDAGKDWRREEKGMTEDEMVGWYHWLNGHEFE